MTDEKTSFSGPNPGSSIVASSGVAAVAAPLLEARDLVPGDVVYVKMLMRHTMGAEQYKDRPWVVTSHHGRLHSTNIGLVHAVPLSIKGVARIGRFETFRVKLLPSEFTSLDVSRLAEVECVALTEQVRALTIERCIGKIGRIDLAKLNLIRAGIRYLNGS